MLPRPTSLVGLLSGRRSTPWDHAIIACAARPPGRTRLGRPADERILTGLQAAPRRQPVAAFRTLITDFCVGGACVNAPAIPRLARDPLQSACTARVALSGLPHAT